MGKKKKLAKASSRPKAPVVEPEVDETPEHEDDDEESAPAAKKKPAAKPRSSASGSVYKIIEVVGASDKSWEHAAQVAVERASQTLEDLRIAEVVTQDLKIEDGAIVAYRTKLRLSFKYRD
jgi:flavin-binding protein dodecin